MKVLTVLSGRLPLMSAIRRGIYVTSLGCGETPALTGNVFAFDYNDRKRNEMPLIENSRVIELLVKEYGANND